MKRFLEDFNRLLKNIDEFGVWSSTWITNGRYYNPGFNKHFVQREPAGTRWLTKRRIQREGLRGWYVR